MTEGTGVEKYVPAWPFSQGAVVGHQIIQDHRSVAVSNARPLCNHHGNHRIPTIRVQRLRLNSSEIMARCACAIDESLTDLLLRTRLSDDGDSQRKKTNTDQHPFS